MLDSIFSFFSSLVSLGSAGATGLLSAVQGLFEGVIGSL